METVLLAVGLLTILGIAPAALALGAHPLGPSAAPNPTVDNVTVCATALNSFQSNAFSVYPGALVHLVVVQTTTTVHTFTLSPVANVTIGSTAFFHTHTPLVNLSLTSVKSFYANFTAPPVGTYEFVCIYHWPTMIGEMTSTTGPPPSSGGSGAMTIPPVDWAIAGAVAAIGAVGAGTAVALRRRRLREERLFGRPPVKKGSR